MYLTCYRSTGNIQNATLMLRSQKCGNVLLLINKTQLVNFNIDTHTNTSGLSALLICYICYSGVFGAFIVLTKMHITQLTISALLISPESAKGVPNFSRNKRRNSRNNRRRGRVSIRTQQYCMYTRARRPEQFCFWSIVRYFFEWISIVLPLL